MMQSLCAVAPFTKNFILRVLSIKAMLYGVLIIAIFNVGELSTAAQDPSIDRRTSAGSAGQSQSIVQVSTIRDVAEITYPDSTTTESKGALQPEAILLVKPLNFNRDGVYIWRDTDGVWNIRCISRNELLVTGGVSVTGGIEMAPGNVGDLRTVGQGQVMLNLGEATKAESATYFKVFGEYLDFDLLINGKRDSSQIYLGEKGKNPKYIPFRLENRPLVAPKENSNEATLPDRPPSGINPQEDANDSRSTVMPSDLGGGGNGGGAGKRKP